jgi:hypothetical protein
VQLKVQRRFQQLQINFAILKYLRWVKLGTLFSTVDTLNQTFLLHQGQKKKTSKEI